MSLSFSSKTAENDANVANQPLITQPAESDEDDIGCQYVREVPPQQIVDKLKKNSPAKSEQKSSDEDENLRGKQNFNMMPLATQASPMSVQTEGTEQEQDVRMAYNNPSEGTQCRELPVQLFQDQDDPERGDAMFKAKIPNFNILAMDDSDSESDSSESEESNNGQYNDADDSEGDDENTNLLSLLARREANKKRHEAFAIQLGLMAGSPKKKEIDSPSPHQSPKQSTTPNPQNTSHSQPLRGMLFSTPYNSNHYRKLSDAAAKEIQQGKDEIAVLRELEERYPHRDNQIRQLWSLLSPALSPQASSRIKLGNAPPPIFVTGPTGGGKTCIVRDVVTHLQETRPSNTEYRVGAAYINCATLEGGIDEIVHSAYRQLALNMKTRWSSLDPSSYRGRKRKRTKRSKSPKRMGAIAKLEEELTNIHCVETSGSENKAKSKTTVVTRGGSDLDSQEMEKVSGNGKGPDKTSKDSSTKDKEMDCQREVAQVRRSRRLKETEDNDNDAFDAGNGAASNAGEVVKETNLDLNATKEAAVKEGDLTASSSPASTTSQVAVATFGQELQQSLFQHPNDCAFLVVDQAERLLSLSSSTAGMSCPKSNFLAQLLLLPSMKGLNLTIIVITKSILLEHSRKLNRIVALRITVAHTASEMFLTCLAISQK